MSVTHRQVLLLNTRTPWDEPPRARHQLAYALAARREVVFVAANLLGPPGLDVIQASKNLTVAIPSWPLHHRRRYRLPVANEIYQRWLFRKLAARFSARLVLNFDHTATQLVHYFPRVAYYCNDYHIRNFGAAAIRAYFERTERSVARKAVACVSTCSYLQRRLGQWNRRSIEVRLGGPHVPKPPQRSFSGERPVRVALVDFLTARKASFDILRHLAADPNLSLTVYGPVAPDAQKLLREIPGIECAGVLVGDALIDALSKADVGIAPYRKDDGNPGRTPNKLWPCLAAGLPFVTTDIAGIREWEFDDGFVYRASDPKEFRERIWEAYSDDTPDRARLRHEFSQQNTWHERAEEILTRLGIAD